MGCHFSDNISPGSVVVSNNFTDRHATSLRHKILYDIPLSFNEKHIVFVFGPPLFPSGNIAKFISFKTGLPVINPSNTILDELSENDGYGDDDFNRLKVDIERLNGMNGFVICNCPRTYRQYDQLMASITCAKSTTFYLNVNKQVARMLRYRWNIWKHPGSGRLYHLIYAPPSSSFESRNKIEQAIRKGQCPHESCLLDDVTHEPLEVIPHGLYCKYLDDLTAYLSLAHNYMGSHFKSVGYHINCSGETRDAEIKVTQILSTVAGSKPLSGYRPGNSTQVSVSLHMADTPDEEIHHRQLAPSSTD